MKRLVFGHIATQKNGPPCNEARESVGTNLSNLPAWGEATWQGRDSCNE